MRKAVEAILQENGSAAVLTRGTEQWNVKALMQPMTGKVERWAKVEMGPLGQIGRGRWIYYGPAEPRAEQGDQVEMAGKQYLVRTAQVIRGHEEPVYCWAMCVEKGAADEWGVTG